MRTGGLHLPGTTVPEYRLGCKGWTSLSAGYGGIGEGPAAATQD